MALLTLILMLNYKQGLSSPPPQLVKMQEQVAAAAHLEVELKHRKEKVWKWNYALEKRGLCF